MVKETNSEVKNTHSEVSTGNTEKRLYPGLKPWKPGQSGNPSGRPKLPISLRKLLIETLAENPEAAKDVIKAHIKQGKTGDMRAIDSMYDQVDGKPTETHKITSEMPISLVFVAYEALKHKKVEEIEAVEGEYQLLEEG